MIQVLVAAAFAAALADGPRAQLAVLASDPTPNGFVGPSAGISVTFDQAVDPTSVTAHSFAAFGRWSGAAPGTFQFSPDLRTVTLWPFRALFSGELVTVTLAETIAAAGGATLAHGHALQAFVRSAPGSRQFQHVATIPFRAPGEGRVGTYGIHAGDVDRDGSPDITAMNEIANDLRLWRNTGCGTFSAAGTIANPGQWPSPNESADLDRDGLLDLVTGNQNGGAVSVYLNDGLGSFTAPAVYPNAGYVHGVAVGDFDGDGFWDVAAPNGTNVCVYLNQGDGTMGAPTCFDGGGNGEDNVGTADFDGDGVLDLVVGNLFSNNMGFLRGVGDGTFQLGQTWPTGGQPFHEAVGDCNGDGHPDALFANRGTNTFAVLFGDGLGGFSAAVTYPVGLTPAAIDVADLDGDLDLDCVVSNYQSGDYSLWWNRGDGVFEQPASLLGAQSGSCSTLVDFDRDGIVDMIGADENDDLALLYRQLDLAAAQTQAPRCGSGLRIDQRGDRAGFGATPFQDIKIGERFSLSLSGPDHGISLLAIGGPLLAGVPAPPWGLVHLDPVVPPDFLFFALDAAGEGHFMLRVAPTVPPGLHFVLQAAVAGTAIQLTNPQGLVTVP